MFTEGLGKGVAGDEEEGLSPAQPSSRKERDVIPVKNITQSNPQSKVFAQFVDEQCQLIRDKLGVDESIVQSARSYALERGMSMVTTKLLKDDRWRVDGVTCSVKGRYCEQCDKTPEKYARQDGGGVLCAHRLAAMIMLKLSRFGTDDQSSGGTALAMLQEIFVVSREDEEVEDVRLKYKRMFNFVTGLKDSYVVVTAYQVNHDENPGTWMNFYPPVSIELSRFESMIKDVKWCVDFTYNGFDMNSTGEREVTTSYIRYEDESETSHLVQFAKAHEKQVASDYHKSLTQFMRDNPDGVYVASKKRLGSKL